MKNSQHLEQKATELIRKSLLKSKMSNFQKALNYLRKGKKLSEIPEEIFKNLYSDQKEELKKFYFRSMEIKEKNQAFSKITGRLHEVAFIEKKNEEEIKRDHIKSEIFGIFRSNTQLKKFCYIN